MKGEHAPLKWRRPQLASVTLLLCQVAVGLPCPGYGKGLGGWPVVRGNSWLRAGVPEMSGLRFSWAQSDGHPKPPFSTPRLPKKRHGVAVGVDKRGHRPVKNRVTGQQWALCGTGSGRGQLREQVLPSRDCWGSQVRL